MSVTVIFIFFFPGRMKNVPVAIFSVFEPGIPKFQLMLSENIISPEFQKAGQTITGENTRGFDGIT